VLALAAVALIAVGAFEPFYLRMFFADRARMAAQYRALPYRRLPGLQRFLDDVRARTTPDDVIAVDGPFPDWDHGYAYCYSRATYALAGRLVLALRDPHGRLLEENLRRATHVIAYRSMPRIDGFAPVWRSADGSLLRRVR